MENPKHAFQLCEVHLPHGYDQAHVMKFTIEFLHIFKHMCQSLKPKSHHLEILFLLGCYQGDLVCLDVPVKTNVSCRAG